MDPEDFAQYEKYYDFTEENRKVAKRIEEKFGHLKSHDNEFVFAIGDGKTKAKAIEANDDNDNDSWEDVDSEDGEVIDEEVEVIEEKAIDDSKVNSKKEFYKLRKVKILSSGEMRLPSGKIAGHRSYMKYYK